MPDGLRVALIVQGEGRGHMTQALSAQEALREAGHRITAVFLGRSELREVPDFFGARSSVEVEAFEAPVLAPDAEERGMSRAGTTLHILRRLPRYAASVRFLARRLREEDPDVVLNFFDLLGALALTTTRPGRLRIAVGHQFFFDHPSFTRPEGSWLGWWGIRLLTEVTGAGAHRRLALSFRPESHPRPGTDVLPPLLRSSVLETTPVEGDHILVYLLNPGYARDLRAWHAERREVPVEAFWDRPGAPSTLQVHENLRIHRIDDRRFVELLRSCRALATTAGFESVSEAMYLGKPVLMVPTRGHFEQRCNALDGALAGAGIRRERFDLDDLLEYLPLHENVGEGFRRWVRSGRERLVKAVEAVPSAGDLPDAEDGTRTNQN